MTNRRHFGGAAQHAKAQVHTKIPPSPFLDSGVRRAASDILSSRRIQDVLSIAALDILSSRRIQDVLSIAASDVLSSRRIQDVLSINDGGG